MKMMCLLNKHFTVIYEVCNVEGRNEILFKKVFKMLFEDAS